MNILHITPYYAPAWGYGGVVRAVYELSKAQAAAGNQVSVLTTDSLIPGQRIAIQDETIDQVDVTRIPNWIEPLRRVNLSTPGHWTGTLNALRQTVVPNVIHCHELRTVESLLTMRAAARWSTLIPIIITPHGTLPQTTGRSAVKHIWDRLFGAVLARQISGWIALNTIEEADIRNWWDNNAPAGLACPPIAVIPNGVDVDSFNWPRVLHNPQSPTVLFLGRLQERKGVQFLIPAFAQAIRQLKLSRAQLLIVGPDEGMLAAAQKLAGENGIAVQVTFTGLLTGAARDQVLQQADLFVLPAIGEGLSIAALEAMAAALPVILTPGCNLPEAESRGAGIIVQRTVDAIAEGLRDLLSVPERRSRMGDAGRSWMQREFTWAHLADQTAAFYESIQTK
jgi:glycosyltransferase involved in cell wall biosynthesis